MKRKPKESMVSFMYAVPPGLREQQEKEEERKKRMEEKEALERGAAELSEKERRELERKQRQLEREERARLPTRPFGVQHTGNLRCLRCKQYGHRSVDRICPMSDKSLNGTAL